MHTPKQRYKESDQRDPSNPFLRAIADRYGRLPKPERSEKLSKKKIEQHAAGRVQQNICEMIAIGIGVPETVIEKIGDGLDRAVVRRKRFLEEVVTETLQNQERTLDEWILPRQVMVVPNALTGQAASSHEKANDKQRRTTEPLRPKIPGENFATKAPTVK
jgi:hypothetical protein